MYCTKCTAQKKFKKFSFWDTLRGALKKMGKVGLLDYSEHFNFFMKKYHFWGVFRLGQGNLPPPSLENCPNFGPTFPVFPFGGVQ